MSTISTDNKVSALSEKAIAAVQSVTSITSEQENLLPVWRDKWDEISLSSRRANKPAAEAAIRLCYEAAGQKFPDLILWGRSPMEGFGIAQALFRDRIDIAHAIAARALPLFDAMVQQHVDDMWLELLNQTAYKVFHEKYPGFPFTAYDVDAHRRWREIVSGYEIASMQPEMSKAAWDFFVAEMQEIVSGFGSMEQFNDPESYKSETQDRFRTEAEKVAREYVGPDRVDMSYHNREDLIPEKTDSNFWADREKTVSAAVHNQNDHGWLAFYDFYHKVLGKEELSILDGPIQAGMSCGWWWPFDGGVVITDRPLHLELDDRRAFHSEDTPAIDFLDGAHRRYFIGGVRVPEEVVMAPETITIEDIRNEDNQEVRRIMIDRFGWLRYLEETGTKVIDHRKNDRDSQTEVLVEDEDGRRHMIVHDPSTGRRYVMGLPREIKSCQEGQMWWSHGLDKHALART